MVFFIVPIAFYLFLIFLIPIIWRITGSNFKESDNKINQLTLVIPFRNEAENISQLLKSIDALKTTIQLKYVFINDHSEDNGAEIVKNWVSKKEGSAVFLDLPQGNIGKKSALNFGIEHVQTNWIWQLDADTTFENNVLDLFEFTAESDKKLILAPVFLVGDKWAYKNQFQIFENVILQFITSFSAQFNSAFLANGANLFYPKSVFESYKNDSVGKSYASGDDMFLLNFVKNKFGNQSVSCLNHPQSAVNSYVLKEKNKFWNQKVRWASKMKNSFLKIPLIVKLFVFFLFFISLLFFIGLFVFPTKIVVSFLLMKFLVEIFSLSIIKGYFKVKGSILLFPLYVFYFPFYLIQIVFSTKKSFEWKSRVHEY